MRLAMLIAVYAVIAAAVYVFFGGTQIPPCFGRVPDGTMSHECVDAWQASRGPIDWLLSTPWPVIAAFLVATGVTIWWFRRQRRRPRAPVITT